MYSQFMMHGQKNIKLLLHDVWFAKYYMKSMSH